MSDLVEHTLFGSIDKVAIAIKLLQVFEPRDGYYLAFSGGKDSVVIKALADMAGVKYDAHYAVSGIDPPDLVRFIKEHHPDVHWERNDVPFLVKIKTKGLPLRRTKWCCDLYKESGGRNRVVVTGVRWAESSRRKKTWSGEIHRCEKQHKDFVNPIVSWEDDDVWEFIRQRDIPYCKLYDEGWSRIGCICCPEASKEQKRKELDRYPAMEKAFKKAFEAVYKRGCERGWKICKQINTSDELFEWWISEDTVPKEHDIPGLFT